jgi:molybdopterin-binding protein
MSSIRWSRAESADEMGLKKSDAVTAVVKATEVMLSKP